MIVNGTKNRSDKIKQQVKISLEQAFDNFSEGVNDLFGYNPRSLKSTEFNLFPAFGYMYTILLWLQKLEKVGSAKALASTPANALPIAVALAGRGAYSACASQVRYAYEALISFLYFRDHPREYELALEGRDLWEHTRPSAVISFLKKLPEYRSTTGERFIALGEDLYRDLSKYAHPRMVTSLQYLSEVAPDKDQHKEFNSSLRRLAQLATALIGLSDREIYTKSSELDRALLRAPLDKDTWRKVSPIS